MDNFVNRLTHLLSHYEHTASSFSDTIGVQRSSLSHLLSGRNKPSLDFIMKIHETFPEVNLYWLLKGDNPFLIGEEFPTILETKQETKITTTALERIEPSTPTQHSASSKEEQETPIQQTAIDTNSPIDQIVIFYKNGTFKNYNPTR